jgi:[ribosomal protein S5]-alanine N-acetyltransferase
VSDGASHPEPPRLHTARLEVRMAGPDDVAAIAAFHRENAEFLRPWDPRRPAEFAATGFWEQRIREAEGEFADRSALRIFLFPLGNPGEAIGKISFTQIVGEPFHACSLGYALAEGAEGRGLMREALGVAIPYALTTLNLHRVQANYMPHNRRSGRLLRELGFTVEGYARDYLRIDGRWEDHVLTSFTDPNWTER